MASAGHSSAREALEWAVNCMNALNKNKEEGEFVSSLENGRFMLISKINQDFILCLVSADDKALIGSLKLKANALLGYFQSALQPPILNRN